MAKQPTTKQGKAIKKILEKGGKISVSKAMREAGYSEKTAKNPKHLTNSKTWKELMKEFLPDEDRVEIILENQLRDFFRNHFGLGIFQENNMLSYLLGYTRIPNFKVK